MFVLSRGQGDSQWGGEKNGAADQPGRWAFSAGESHSCCLLDLSRLDARRESGVSCWGPGEREKDVTSGCDPGRGSPTLQGPRRWAFKRRGAGDGDQTETVHQAHCFPPVSWLHERSYSIAGRISFFISSTFVLKPSMHWRGRKQREERVRNARPLHNVWKLNWIWFISVYSWLTVGHRRHWSHQHLPLKMENWWPFWYFLIKRKKLFAYFCYEVVCMNTCIYSYVKDQHCRLGLGVFIMTKHIYLYENTFC